LATLGTTAAVFAHEIANPLNGLSVSLDLLKTILAKGVADEVRETIEIASLELKRLSSLLKDYRSFARPQRLNLHLTDLRKLVEVVLASQIRRYSALGVKVEMSFQDQLPLLMIDETKMKQAILNLCQNGVEAMPTGGTLTVRGSQQGDNIVISITDSGTGIAPGIDVFQLFRTTKRDGSGLGLPIVQQIVADHRGTVDYVTDPGKGTTFRIVLPLSNRVA
jgi:signal transduction histidine kinase